GACFCWSSSLSYLETSLGAQVTQDINVMSLAYAKFGVLEVTETTTKVTIVAMVMSAKLVTAVKEAAVMIIMDFSQ
ncbi:unnamed protein product, partial [Porites evermanni]